jgi:hypothetical protein
MTFMIATCAKDSDSAAQKAEEKTPAKKLYSDSVYKGSLHDFSIGEMSATESSRTRYMRYFSGYLTRSQTFPILSNQKLGSDATRSP